MEGLESHSPVRAAPILSVVVVAYDMARELPRTVQSLQAPYQIGLGNAQVEIIVVDNKSTTPVQIEDFSDPQGVTVIRVEDGGQSPCRAINQAASQARGEYVALMIDGARMASPQLLVRSLEAVVTRPEALVITLGLHLGPKTQQVSTTEGYDREEEDRLLRSIGWPQDGYRLFEVSALGESYAKGANAMPPETTFCVMRRAQFNAIGGFDERFTSLGGGFANFDFLERAGVGATPVLLVGEATFHQLHFGATTQAGGIRRSVDDETRSLGEVYAEEYERLRGRVFRARDDPPLLYGSLTHPRVGPMFFPIPNGRDQGS